MANSNNGASRPERGKHVANPSRELDPNRVPDLRSMEKAVEDGDYVAFRREIVLYESWLEDRVGRWVQRYPELEAQIGNEVKISDLVEDVFLNAFEHFRERPESTRLRDWLEEFIDPTAKAMLTRRDQELENVGYARTMLEARPQEGS